MKKVFLILAVLLAMGAKAQTQQGSVVIDNVETSIGVSTDSLFFEFIGITGKGTDSCVTISMTSYLNPTTALDGKGNVLPLGDNGQVVNKVDVCFEKAYYDSIVAPLYFPALQKIQEVSGWDTIIPYIK